MCLPVFPSVLVQTFQSSILMKLHLREYGFYDSCIFKPKIEKMWLPCPLQSKQPGICFARPAWNVRSYVWRTLSCLERLSPSEVGVQPTAPGMLPGHVEDSEFLWTPTDCGKQLKKGLCDLLIFQSSPADSGKTSKVLFLEALLYRAFSSLSPSWSGTNLASSPATAPAAPASSVGTAEVSAAFVFHQHFAGL